jgi:hypothetical protein
LLACIDVSVAGSLLSLYRKLRYGRSEVTVSGYLFSKISKYTDEDEKPASDAQSPLQHIASVECTPPNAGILPAGWNWRTINLSQGLKREIPDEIQATSRHAAIPGERP